MGVLEVFRVVVTIHKKAGPPLTFGLQNDRPHQDLLGVQVQRGLNAAGVAAITLQGLTANGRRWLDLIDPMDVVEISATARRNPDRLSHPWRSIFLGFVQTVAAGQKVGSRSITRNTTVVATDAMGILDYETFNYWRGTVVGGPGFDNDPDATQKALRLGRVGSALGLANSGAMVTEQLFKSIIYGFFNMQRNVGGKSYFWEDLHSYRFESDAQTVAINVSQLPPQGDTWRSAAMMATDAPEFHEFFIDSVPVERVDGKGLVDPAMKTVRNEVRFSKPAGLILPGGRVEMFRLRPLPFPVYDKDLGGYDAEAWTKLPTVRALEEVGSFERTISRSRDAVFTHYSVLVSPSPGGNGEEEALIESAKADKLLVDVQRAKDFGYRARDAGSRRSILEFDQSGKSRGSRSSLPDFIRRLTREQFSFHQYNDRFYIGQIQSSLDLRMEVGCRYLDDDILYYAPGYTHTFTPTEATTEIKVERGLPVRVYEDEFPKYLGRARPGEAAPVEGSAAVEGLEGLTGGRHV